MNRRRITQVMPEKITQVNVVEQYKKDYKLYALYVCRHRVAVDLRDGLKPVARKILYSAFNFKSKTKYPNTLKSATIVGDVIGNYHPHGTDGVYGAMKSISNDFEIYIPLLNKHGSWGDKFGSSAAAMRYTESGLSQFAQEYLLKDLYNTPNCVDWLSTFDNSDKEPECLPAAVPIALIEGTFGLAVGFKVEIPKHNITEVLDATINLIRNRNSKVVLIPDHCLPCDIIGTDFDVISNTGLGSYTVRGIIEEGTFEGEPTLFIKSAPDLVYLKSIQASIENLIASKKIINVARIDNHDDILTVRFKRGTDLTYAKQLIYQYTKMEMACRVNFEVLDNGVPMRMSYKSYLLQWLEFRKFTKFRLYCNGLQTVSTRLHTIEPYVKIARSNDIFELIKVIKDKNMAEEDLIEMLIKKYDITDLQAKFILNVRVKELSESFFSGYIDEYNKLCLERDRYMELITNESAAEEDILQELIECKRKYGKKRNCRVISKGEAKGIASGSFKMVFTHNNFVKKLPINDNIPAFKNDSAKFIVPGDNAENLIVFNEMGKVYKLPIHKIPFSDKRSNGIDIRLLIKNCTSNINAVMYEPTLKDFINKLNKYYIVTLTRNGYIKKMDLDDFLSANASGLIYAKLDDGDYIKDVMIIRDSSDVVVYSSNKCVRFSMQEVPHLKRATRGNKTMAGEVDGLSIIKEDTTDIIVVTKKGYINRFTPVALLSSDRTSRPSKVIKLSKGDEILSVFGLSNSDTLIVNSTSGRVTIPVDTIPIGSSVGSGTKMIPNKSDTIVSCGFFHNKS